MRHSILWMVSILTLLSGCSKEESGTNNSDNGEKYVLDFSSGGSVNTRAGGSEGLMANSNISISVFKGATGNGESTFLDSPYLVTTDKTKLVYRNDLGLGGKQGIVSVSAGIWSIYGAGVNDGDGTGRLSLATGTPESAATYATQNGYEYVFCKAEDKTVDNTPVSRAIKMTFERQVAKVVFTVKAGDGLKALPEKCTEEQKVEEAKMKLPARSGDTTEGLLEVTQGITKPLTQVTADLVDGIYKNKVGEVFGFYYFVLPLSMGADTFAAEFKLKVAETGGQLGELRTFNVTNIPLPDLGEGKYGFAKGKLYNYTVTVSNTGLYLLDVNVVDWITEDKGDLPAQ